jgi:hypothetical protein
MMRLNTYLLSILGLSFAFLISRTTKTRATDTNEYQYEGFDELTAFNEFRYTYLTSRVRSVISGVPPIIRSATNPGNIGHIWVRQRFIEPAPNGGARIYDSNSETYRIFIRALLTDNPYLLEKDPGYIKRLRILLSQSKKLRYMETGGYSQARSSQNGEIHFLELDSQTSQKMLATLSKTLNHQSGCPESSPVIGDIIQGRSGSVGQSLLLTNEPFYIEKESGPKLIFLYGEQMLLGCLNQKSNQSSRAN